MNTKLTKIFSIAVIILLFVFNICSVNASSFEFNASAQKEIFKPGEEVIVDLVIDNIDAGEYGINVVETRLQYENNILEFDANSGFIAQNNWNYAYNNNQSNQKYGKLLYSNISSGITSKQSIGKIKFKLKPDLPDLETEIVLKQVTSNDGKALMNVGDKVVKIKVINDTDPTPDPNPTPDPDPDPNPNPTPDPDSDPDLNPTPNPDPDPEKENPTKNTPNNNQENKIIIKKEENQIPQTGQTRVLYITIGSIIAVTSASLVTITIISKKNKNNQK